ncbi:M4 family metallopeptidase [Chryseobacterium wangxinyae]|uniref:M4 family metallopeptidase n=1 Tax=Chryseobacterium sp. CY350 TaxID=2997336 RepID=UPI002270C21B|nr:M4 family metallopeptidase [Chryseobacterium sp. CY350]MCY0977334.1 M4 family metallopeptidase [Chryseobacterium sp. CY350]WBZ95647.1 M4 family metallopeptidase [Chryseobacterium sp. CY350]
MKKTVTIVKTLAFVLTMGITSQNLTAQSHRTEISLQDLPRITTTSAMGNFQVSFEGKNISAEALVNQFGKWLQTNSDHSYQFLKSSVDELGFKRNIYQHLYKGIKVNDDIIYIHEKDGKVTYVNGEIISNITINISQPLPENEIKEIIFADIKNKKTTFGEFEHVIAKVSNREGIHLYTATKVQAAALGALKAFDYYIDDKTGKIVNKISKIYDYSPDFQLKLNLPARKIINSFDYSPFFVDTPSTSATYYKGNQNVTVDSNNNSFRLKDNNKNIHTRNGSGWDGSANLATNELTGNITEITSTAANFTSATTKAPVEAHWAMEKAKDYYIARHNRNSYDGNGSIIKNYYDINFNVDATTGAPLQPKNGANAAAFDVTQQGFSVVGMLYGNGMYQGQAGFFGPFVGIDVAGHEYSHIMVSRTANLAYQGESGALNEAFADMFGASIEFYSGISPNWNIGEGIPNSAMGFTFLRSMSNPNSGPAALGSQQPDTYLGTYWAATATGSADNGGIHTNSGVGNFWFYLLSVGGTGTNDSGTNYNVTGITIQKAEKIAYRTLATYLTANSQYTNAYTASKQATVDLYGAGSSELQQVENAWCAVGIGNCASLLSVSDTVKSDSDNIKIYPNPVTSGQFTIQTDSKGNGTYEIYDLSGKLIRSSEKLEKGNVTVNTRELQKGVYIVKIKIEGKTISKKIIVSY